MNDRQLKLLESIGARVGAARLRNELISVERVISDLLEVESSVKEAKNVREER